VAKEWTEEQTKVISEYVSVAQVKSFPMVQAFNLAADELDESDSSIGVYYYNHIKGKLDLPVVEGERLVEISQLFLDAIRNKKAKGNKRWKQEEDDLILETMSAKKEDEQLMDICEELAKLLDDRTPLAISRRYYNIRSSDDESSIAKSPNSWTKEEDAILLQAIDDGMEEGLTKTKVFEQLAEYALNNRSTSAIQKHYTALRPARKLAEQSEQAEQAEQETAAAVECDISADELHTETETASTEPSQEAETDSGGVLVPKEILEVLGQLPEAMAGIQSRLAELEKREVKPDVQSVVDALITMADGYKERDELKKQIEDIREVHWATIEKFTNQVNDLKFEKLELEKNFGQLQDKMAEAEAVFDTFINMASVSQVLSLGDFKCRMKSVIDRWGNVIKVDFEREAQG
jgi:hypothetical protein